MLILLAACFPRENVIELEDEHSESPWPWFVEEDEEDDEEEGSEESTGSDTSSEPPAVDTGEPPAVDTGEPPAWDTGKPPGEEGEEGEEGEDTGSPDTEDPNDPPEDTGPTCAGLDEPSPRTFSVWSETPYEEVEVTLSGCATGITINDSYMSAGGHYYWTGTWLSVPGNVNGTATAVLAYRGSEATVGWLEFYIDTDQGQQRFTLEVRQYL